MRVFDGLRFKRVLSPIHRLDPRVKFVIACIIFILTVMFTELIPLVIIFLAQMPLVFVAKVQREWFRSLKGSALFALIIFLTNLIVGFTVSGYKITSDNLMYSIAMTVRFIALIASFSIFFLTTSPDDLGLALEQSHVPYEFCFAFTTAVRFVPALANEAQTIVDAQRSRGLELEKGGFIKRVKNYIPILIPLIVNAIRRSLELAEAMEARAFGANKRRTNLYVLKIKAADYFALTFSILIFIFALYIRYFTAIPSIKIPLF